MKIISSAFKSSEAIPPRYTCDGENISPPLEIFEIPESTQSLALVVSDPHAPGGNFLHWILYNISPHENIIDENSIPDQAVQIAGNSGKSNYSGPCPPSGTHRYIFTLYALNKIINFPKLSLEGFFKIVNDSTIEKAQLIGLYKR